MGGLGYAPTGGLSKIVNGTSVSDGTGDVATASAVFIDMAKLAAVSIPAAAGDVLFMGLDAAFFADPAVPSVISVAFAVAGATKTDVLNITKGATVIDWVLPLHISRFYTVQQADIVDGIVSVTARWKVSANAFYGNTANGVATLKVMNLAH
jgi:hypothetical protein